MKHDGNQYFEPNMNSVDVKPGLHTNLRDGQMTNEETDPQHSSPHFSQGGQCIGCDIDFLFRA